MDDIKLIKDKYGEKMAHLCRTLFPTILDTKGLLFDILSKNFVYSKELYWDILKHNLVDEFSDFVIKSSVKTDSTNLDEEEERTPFEILKNSGYTLYECRTESEIQEFKKYYAPGEELCTFDGGRLNTCYVFFAVKDNVSDIRREDFTDPKREDEYGTSVISIQFKKGANNYVSIKNRYNHTIVCKSRKDHDRDHPDATYSNELDDIGGIVQSDGKLDEYGKSKGLTAAFRKHYGFKISAHKPSLFIPKYIEASDGKKYKYNYQIDNLYYCGDNTVISFYQVISKYLDKNRYLVFDYFALDLINKKIVAIDHSLIGKEGLINLSIDNVFDKLSILKDKEKSLKTITLSNEEGKVSITLDKSNRMISYYDDITKIVDPNYFAYSEYLKSIELPNAEFIKSNFLPNCENIEYFSAPKLKKVGKNFMPKAKNAILNTPNLFTPEQEVIETIDGGRSR